MPPAWGMREPAEGDVLAARIGCETVCISLAPEFRRGVRGSGYFCWVARQGGVLGFSVYASPPRDGRDGIAPSHYQESL